MDLTSISTLSAISGLNNVNETSSVSTVTGVLSELSGLNTSSTNGAEGTMFDALLNTAIENINTTNSYLSDAEDEELKFALGETESTHDLTIALQKASTALQYTVAIRDKVLEAYKELMQMQI